jgi:hypothetical protein
MKATEDQALRGMRVALALHSAGALTHERFPTVEFGHIRKTPVNGWPSDLREKVTSCLGIDPEAFLHSQEVEAI